MFLGKSHIGLLHGQPLELCEILSTIFNLGEQTMDKLELWRPRQFL